MRLSNFLGLRISSGVNFTSASFKLSVWLILAVLLFELFSGSLARTDPLPRSHLISPKPHHGPSQILLRRVIRSASPPSDEDQDKDDRSEKQVIRMELLRQIKAIDHMKCFPKVLCGLSVDTGKQFGLNKSNFVRSYLELMRNIRPPQEGEDNEHRLRTEDEVEGELLWPFSPHNPERKQHSSFERLSSAALSASVEQPDSLEYLSRGLESKLGDMDASASMEKADRLDTQSSERGNMQFKDKTVNSHNHHHNHHHQHQQHSSSYGSLPGEMKKKESAKKGLTAKLTSYFSSWLPSSMVSFGKESRYPDSRDDDDSFETEMDMSGRGNDEWKLSEAAFAVLPELWEDWLKTSPPKQGRQAKASGYDQEASPSDNSNIEAVARQTEGTDGDIYHTAVNIGKRLKDPKQCDYIYNGCPLEYNKILDMIGSIETVIHANDERADAVSFEFGLQTPTPATTTTTTTTTTKKPQKKKPRPSTKIMHTLPNGEKVEINFRLGGSEDSEETDSAQRDYGVVEVGERGALSTSSLEEESGGEKRFSHRKGSPVMDSYMVKNKHSNKKKTGYLAPKRNIQAERRNEGQERSEELGIDTREETSGHQNSRLKLSGLTLSTSNSKDEPLEISPSYVIIKHQPLSVHTTSVMSPDSMHGHGHGQQQGDHRPQPFQLMQNGQQQIDTERITDELKNYIRQSGGLIPKLSLHSSGMITTDGGDNLRNQHNQNPFNIHRQSADLTSSVLQNFQHSFQNPLAGLNLDNPSGSSGLLQLSQLSTSPFQSVFPQSPYSPSAYASRGPAMVGAVPGRMDAITKLHTLQTGAPTTSTTTTTTTSTTTEKMDLSGMQETVTLDTDEITDDTLTKLEGEDTVPGWLQSSPIPTSESRESESEEDDEQTILENLNKALSESNKRSKVQYKNTKKKKIRVKANSSRVRPIYSASSAEGNHKRYKNKKKNSAERVVIKHAGPYSGSPTVYQSPLSGPGPHGGAYPYLPHGSGLKPYPGFPLWRYPM